VIFSRNRGSESGSGRHAKDPEARRTPRARDRAQRARDDDQDEVEQPKTSGPYDITEAPEGIALLDLGALRIPAVDGVEVRVQADESGAIQQVVLANGESALQLGVFAAPRSEGIWDEVRAEIRKQLFTDGVAAEEVDGDYGQELRARVRTPDGLTDIRFVGVDGPRWFVRAVYQGPAAVDPSVAPGLAECLNNLVVDRGQEAKPVREPLTLRLPKEIADQHAAEIEAQAAAEGAAPSAPEPPTNGATPGRPSPRRRPSPKPRKR
jgi:hypothetical protein